MCTQASLDQPCLSRHTFHPLPKLPGGHHRSPRFAPGQGHLWGISDSLLFLTFQVDSSISCWASGQEAEQSFLPHSSDSPPAGPPEPASALTADHLLPGKVNSYLFETQSALLSLNPVPQLHSQVRAAVGVFPQLRGCDGQDCTHRLCILQAVPRDGVSVVL